MFVLIFEFDLPIITASAFLLLCSKDVNEKKNCRKSSQRLRQFQRQLQSCDAQSYGYTFLAAEQNVSVSQHRCYNWARCHLDPLLLRVRSAQGSHFRGDNFLKEIVFDFSFKRPKACDRYLNTVRRQKSPSISPYIRCYRFIKFRQFKFADLRSGLVHQIKPPLFKCLWRSLWFYPLSKRRRYTTILLCVVTHCSHIWTLVILWCHNSLITTCSFMVFCFVFDVISCG